MKNLTIYAAKQTIEILEDVSRRNQLLNNSSNLDDKTLFENSGEDGGAGLEEIGFIENGSDMINQSAYTFDNSTSMGTVINNGDNNSTFPTGFLPKRNIDNSILLIIITILISTLLIAFIWVRT